MQKPLEERFWNKVDKGSDPNGCWLWMGIRINSGYGRIMSEGRHQLVHRVSYQLAVGSIPPDMVIDHLCRNRLCVNPQHLEPVTQHENNQRAIPFMSAAAKKRHKEAPPLTHCPSGHPYTPDNIYIVAGRRRCKTCQKARTRAYLLSK